MLLRHEEPADAPVIAALVTKAFLDAAHRSGTEAEIVTGLRRDDGLTLSLVAVERGAVVGHVAFSPVTVDGAHCGWFGLGPLAVDAAVRRRGIGRRLVETGLATLQERGAGGCVVLGDPAYYGRFGFRADPSIVLAGVPVAFFQSLRLSGPSLTGEVRYHRAFDGA